MKLFARLRTWWKAPQPAVLMSNQLELAKALNALSGQLSVLEVRVTLLEHPESSQIPQSLQVH